MAVTRNEKRLHVEEITKSRKTFANINYNHSWAYDIERITSMSKVLYSQNRIVHIHRWLLLYWAQWHILYVCVAKVMIWKQCAWTKANVWLLRSNAFAKWIFFFKSQMAFCQGAQSSGHLTRHKKQKRNREKFNPSSFFCHVINSIAFNPEKKVIRFIHIDCIGAFWNN